MEIMESDDMKRKLNVSIIAVLAVALWACSKEETYVPYSPKTPVGKILLERESEVARIFSDTTFMLAVGVEETDLQVQTMEGYVHQLHLISVDTNVPGVRMVVSMPNNSTSISGGWRRQTLTGMATDMDVPRARVTAMVNGDFWQTTAPINPRGPVHKGGAIISSAWDYDPKVAQQALSFIAIKDDGSMIIAPRNEYDAMRNSLKECTGSGFMVLENGKYPGHDWAIARDPRTAIGYTEDGIIWLLTCDGRMTFAGDGMTYKELAYILKAVGCKNAANLDGGGSAQMLIRHPIADVWQIRNNPADGKEREVINGWAVLVDEP